MIGKQGRPIGLEEIADPRAANRGGGCLPGGSAGGRNVTWIDVLSERETEPGEAPECRGQKCARAASRLDQRAGPLRSQNATDRVGEVEWRLKVAVRDPPPALEQSRGHRFPPDSPASQARRVPDDPVLKALPHDPHFRFLRQTRCIRPARRMSGSGRMTAYG